eukprot:4179256-Prymnesium_polylepis.1
MARSGGAVPAHVDRGTVGATPHRGGAGRAARRARVHHPHVGVRRDDQEGQPEHHLERHHRADQGRAARAGHPPRR